MDVFWIHQQGQISQGWQQAGRGGMVECSALGKTAPKVTFALSKSWFLVCGFAGQKGRVSVGTFPSEERGWGCRVVAVLDHLQGLTNHLEITSGASCCLQKGFVEKAFNPEEEVWIPEQPAWSFVQLSSQVNTTLKQDKPNPKQALPRPRINQCRALKRATPGRQLRAWIPQRSPQGPSAQG